jgi:uncharacterized low-complexity protein
MSKKTMIPAAIAGAALIGSLAAVNIASAGENPFAAKPLDSGYMQLAGETGEGKCGEGKCGEGKGAEGKCGEGKDTKEGKCGEGKCGGK